MFGVGADFLVPHGWPAPTDRWIRINALWQPPPGWTPLPDLPSAADGWRFWSPNRAWHVVNASAYAHLGGWVHATTGALLAGFAGAAAARLLDLPLLYLVAAGALLVALGCRVVHAVQRRRLTAVLFAAATFGAEHARRNRLVADYQRYLALHAA